MESCKLFHNYLLVLELSRLKNYIEFGGLAYLRRGLYAFGVFIRLWKTCAPSVYQELSMRGNFRTESVPGER